jgi:acyl-CoA thioesterase I
MATDPSLENGKNKCILIVAMGDSLTVGFGVDETQAFPALLEQKLRSTGYDSRIISAGVNGEKSGEALARVDRVLELRPDIVIVQTGTNDGLRGVAPEVTRENIDAIVRILTEQGIKVVVAGMRNLKPRKGNFDDEFSSIYPQVAARYGAILMPFFLEGVAGNQVLNRADGIHPTAEGYSLVVSNLFPYVEQAVRELNNKHEEQKGRE